MHDMWVAQNFAFIVGKKMVVPWSSMIDERASPAVFDSSLLVADGHRYTYVKLTSLPT